MKIVRAFSCLRSTRRNVPGLLLTATLSLPVLAAPPDPSPLPTLGGAGGGLISDQQEAQIGQQVLRSLRQSAPKIKDTLVQDYLDAIIHRLIPSVPLNDKQFTVVAIDSPDINAFAVPGNIIGVNGGLFLNAETEQEFGSVIAHELAHLGQRHFARRLEQQETSAPLTMAGMIAGIVLSAVTRSDIGIAAIAGTQAMSVQNQLQYSRANEQEADRMGLQILADAGMDPRGMPRMFDILQRQNRLQGNQIPEYLSTHPLTQSRVSDTRNRAEQYPEGDFKDTLEYHLVRSRLRVHYAQSPSEAVSVFHNELDKADSDRETTIAHYGLAVALIANDKPAEAIDILHQLLEVQPNRITFQVTLGNALMAENKAGEARTLLRQALQRNPGNLPILSNLAAAELKDGRAGEAADDLRQLTRDYPQREDFWLRLAEAEGQARNIVGVHRARAEYDILMGDLEAAERQLREAQQKIAVDAPMRQVITERLNKVTEAIARQNR